MPRRNNAAKRLNNSTDPKVDSQRDASQPHERVIAGQPSQQPQHRMLTSDVSMRNTSQNAAGGDTNDSTMSPPNLPQHVPALVNPIAHKPRPEQIQEVLSHRKLLLLRIRQSKSAAELRLKKPSKRTIVSILVEHEGETGKSEADAYKELTKIAVQVAKKQREEEKQPAEKRVSVSLRRGASVGKRMNAALSVLTPGPSSEDGPIETSQLTIPAIIAPKKMKQTVQTLAPPGKTISHDVAKKRASMKNHKAQPYRQPYQYAAPTPISIPENPSKPAVVFPEAIALRERRNQVQAKLKIILEEQKQRTVNSEKSPVFCKDVSVLPNKFPQRRKTHWDYLLEEMQWLATDFVEERKWKASTGRLLSAGVLSHYSTLRKAAEDKDRTAATKVEKMVEREKMQTQDDVMESIEKIVMSEPADAPQRRRFVNPSDEDLLLVKSNAKRIAKMVVDQWDGIVKLGNATEPGAISTKNERRLLSEASPVNTSGSSEAAERCSTSIVVSPEPENGLPAFSHDAIGKKVDTLLDRIERRPRQRTRSKQSSTKFKYTLSPVEQKASDFVEFVWKANFPAGAILGDAYSFSPYDVASSLLKQHQGTHLVLCPPARVMRWMSEFKRINNKSKVLLLTGDSRGRIEDFPETDIVVGELSSVMFSNHLNLSKFETVVLDGYLSLGTRKNMSGKAVRERIHTELLSETWWSSLLRSLSSKTQRRLFMANSYMMEHREHDQSVLRHLTERERLGLFAGMTAFVLGPWLFQGPKKHPTHRVLSWARYHVNKDQTKNGTKIEQIESHLVAMLTKMTFVPWKHFDNVQHSFEEKSIFDTEVHLCKMSPLQQAAYDKCCRNVRGALSLGGSLLDAAKSFIQLRDVCFHARLRDACIASSTNSSQPDMQQAIEIINESSKLKELIIILHRDFGVQFPGISLLEQVIPELQPKSRRTSKATKDEVPKIAIVASSPFVQYLTSVLLSALGVDHENMAGRRSVRTSSDCSLTTIDGPKTNPLRSLRETLPWIEKQRSLLRYSNEKVDPLGFPYPNADELVTPRAANIVLGSPTDLSQNESDLSLEASDAIIFLDEDWSGKECRLVKRILVRCFLHRARYEAENADFRAYRFVCSDCCEERLLCGFKDNDNTEGLYQEKWATNPAGLLELEEAVDTEDESFDHFDPDYVFEFPVRNLVSFENEDLTSFLRTKEPLPANLESGKELKFLPFVKRSAAHGSIKRETILSFAQELMQEESALRTEARALGIAFYSDTSCAPPFVAIEDVFVSTTRLYMESFALSDSAEQVSLGNKSSALHANSKCTASEASVTQRDIVENTLLSERATTSSEEVSASILFYCAGESEGLVRKRKRGHASKSEDSLSAQSSVLYRYNAFCNAYALSIAEGSVMARDGSQGLEPLVYFPPVFPALRQISRGARKDLSELVLRNKNSRMIDTKGGTSAEALKRPLGDTESALEGKRQRLEIIPTVVDATEVAASKLEMEPLQHAQFVSSIGTPQQVKPLGIAQNVGGSNGSFEIAADSALCDTTKSLLVSLDEDFGIVGAGAIPLHSHSLREALKESVELSEYSTHTTEPTEPSTGSSSLSCDFEEAELAARNGTETALEAMILFVARKAPTSSRPHYPPSPAFTSHPQIAPWNTAGATAAVVQNRGPGFNGVAAELKSNGAVGMKKMKKAVTPTSFAHTTGQQVAPGVPFAPTTLQSTPGLTATVNPMKGKDAVRHKIIAMYGKQGFGGPGLFEASKFRLAAIRVRDRISERVSSYIRRSGVFSGRQKHMHQNRSLPQQLQTSAAQDWTSLVSVNSADLNSWSESISADFGPFWVGSFQSGGFVAKIPHPKSGMGLGLPPGVMVPESHPLHPGKSWTLFEDKALHLLASRFSMNWYLVAGSLRDANNKLSRSPGQCYQRWHLLAKSNPAIYSDMLENRRAASLNQEPPDFRKAKQNRALYSRKFQGGDPTDIDEDTEVHVPKLLRTNGAISAACLVPDPETQTPSDIVSPELKTRRSFASFHTASLKKYEVPINIPGVAAGQKPSISAPHPSHQQSLQAAVAAQSTGGRTEMWPLQILDLADKQKKAAAASTSTSRSPLSHHASTGSYQATQSRHAPVQQYAPQPNAPAHKVGIPPKPQSSSGK